MRRASSIAILFLVLALLMPVKADGVSESKLISLSHNAPTTGKMIPEAFSPDQPYYLLTVASWVSRISFTPTAAPNTSITVNGEIVANGQKSQYIKMTDDPQSVKIVVTAYDSAHSPIGQTAYTVFLQRRPSEKRTRVSAGYITQIDMVNDIAKVSADLVTVKYQQGSNVSTFYNDTVYVYRYETDPNCLFYYGSKEKPVRAYDAQDFVNNYQSFGSTLYTMIYIEDKIVCVLPYGSD